MLESRDAASARVAAAFHRRVAGVCVRCCVAEWPCARAHGTLHGARACCIAALLVARRALLRAARASVR
eukprot:2636182-Alexandrium_andersonii.AAC.1